MLWTIVTVWILYIFDNNWFDRPIRDHSIQSLAVFLPRSIFEWILIASWIVPLLFVIFYAFFVNRLMRTSKGATRPTLFPSVFGSMGRFDWWLIGISGALAIFGWTVASTQVLLPATILVIGLSFSKFERWCTLA